MPAAEKEEKDSRCDSGFSRPARLHAKKDIDTLFRRGKRLRGKCVTLIYGPAPGRTPRVAVIVPKRLGSAARRNRVRRVLREEMRQGRIRVPRDRSFLVLYRKPAGEEHLAEARKELESLLARLDGEHR